MVWALYSLMVINIISQKNRVSWIHTKFMRNSPREADIRSHFQEILQIYEIIRFITVLTRAAYSTISES